jgi:hypothetical protein
MIEFAQNVLYASQKIYVVVTKAATGSSHFRFREHPSFLAKCWKYLIPWGKSMHQHH